MQRALFQKPGVDLRAERRRHRRVAQSPRCLGRRAEVASREEAANPRDRDHRSDRRSEHVERPLGGDSARAGDEHMTEHEARHRAEAGDLELGNRTSRAARNPRHPLGAAAEGDGANHREPHTGCVGDHQMAPRAYGASRAPHDKPSDQYGGELEPRPRRGPRRAMRSPPHTLEQGSRSHRHRTLHGRCLSTWAAFRRPGRG